MALLSPQGERLTQETVRRLGRCGPLVLLCGRYEGIDERVVQFVDEEISIGDYVLSGGELPALVVVLRHRNVAAPGLEPFEPIPAGAVRG